MARKGSTLIAKELNEAGYRNTVGKLWKPMDIPKFVYDCKNVGTMIINKERHDFESKQTIKLPKEEWVYVENALPPIVTQEEWDLICKIHEERVIATGSDRRGKKPADTLLVVSWYVVSVGLLTGGNREYLRMSTGYAVQSRLKAGEPEKEIARWGKLER